MRKAGDVVGSGYVLASLLGQGASAEVWLAHRGAQAVAVKILRPEYGHKPRFLQRFEREVRLLGGLMHPGIPRLYEAELSPAGPFVVMAVAPGVPLDRWLRERAERGQALTLATIERVLIGAAEALGHAHAHGIIHRDLKPSNITWDEESGRVMVLDLGLAKRVDEVTGDQTTVGRVLGTPLYLAPEQVEAKPVSARTDVFALSSIAFELFTLRHAWGRDGEDRPLTLRTGVDSSDPFNSALAIALRVLSGLPPRVSALEPAWPATLDDALALGWAKDPAQRPERPEALVELISAAAAGRAVRRLAPPMASTAVGASRDTKPLLPSVLERTSSARAEGVDAPDTDPLRTSPVVDAPSTDPLWTAPPIDAPNTDPLRTAPVEEAPSTRPLWTAAGEGTARRRSWPWLAGIAGLAAVAAALLALRLERAPDPAELPGAPPSAGSFGAAPASPAATSPTSPTAQAAAPAPTAEAAAPAPTSPQPSLPSLAPTAPSSPAPLEREAEPKPSSRARPRPPSPSPPPTSAPPSPAPREPARASSAGAPDLEAELAALEAQPGDGARLSAFVEAIMRRAARLPEAKRRAPEALARRALFGGGPAQARAALEALRRAEADAQ